MEQFRVRVALAASTALVAASATAEPPNNTTFQPMQWNVTDRPSGPWSSRPVRHMEVAR